VLRPLVREEGYIMPGIKQRKLSKMQATTSTSITRAEYDRLLLSDEPLPKATVLIEPNGKKVDLFLTPGQTVARTNPRIQLKQVRDAITLLADLTEAEGLGNVERNWDAPADFMPLSELIESGEAYQVEHDAKLGVLVNKALQMLEQWLKTPAANKKQYLGLLFREKALSCVSVLRALGF
jgi:hypothetical protein